MHWIDPDHLPRTEGTVDRFLINPHGEIDGILLADGLEVHVPPHLSGEIRAAVQPGAAIAVRGVRPRQAGMIAAVAIEAGPGQRIVDNGPPGKDGERGGEGRDDGARRVSMEAEGVVQRSLRGPKGEVRGALLEDGRIVRVPPHEAREHEALLRPGARLAARGPGLTADGATVIDAKELGASMAGLTRVKPKGDGKPPKPHKHDAKHPRHG